MKNYYNFEETETILSFAPLYHRYVVSVFFLGISILAVCLATIYASPYDRKIWYFFSSVLSSYALYHLIISRNTVYVFDRVHRTVSKNYAQVFSRTLTTFDNIYNIHPVGHTQNGMDEWYQYALSKKDNRFWKSYELSPLFSGDNGEEQVFYETILLPRLEDFLEIPTDRRITF